eukprot:11164332-Lingulodinium_polyedra.AAC.1
MDRAEGPARLAPADLLGPEVNWMCRPPDAQSLYQPAPDDLEHLVNEAVQVQDYVNQAAPGRCAWTCSGADLD